MMDQALDCTQPPPPPNFRAFEPMASLSALSDETLLAVFIWNSRQHLKPIHDPLKTTLATSHVSRRFREIMLKHPILWTNSFDISRPLPFIKHILHRRMDGHPIETLVIPSITPFLIQNHKIRGEIEMYAYHEFPTINTLFNNPIKLSQFANRLLHVVKLLPQARNLILKIPYHGWLLLEMLFEFSVAHLESLALMRDEVDMHAEFKTCTVVTLSSVLRKAQSEWNMRTLRFRGCCVELNSPAFAGLENLYVHQLPTAVAMTSSALVEVLRVMPRLKRVRLIDVLLAVRYPNSVSTGMGAAGGAEEFRHLAQPIVLPNLVEFILWGHIAPVAEVVYSLDIPPDCATSIYGKGLTSHRGPDPPILLILHQLRVTFNRQQPSALPLTPITSNTKVKRKKNTASLSETMSSHPRWWNTLVVQMRPTTCRVRAWRQVPMSPLNVNVDFANPDATSSSNSGQPPMGLELSFAWNEALSTPTPPAQPLPLTRTRTSPLMAVDPSTNNTPRPLVHAHTYPGPISANLENNVNAKSKNNNTNSLNNNSNSNNSSRSPVVLPPPRFSGGGALRSPTMTLTPPHSQSHSHSSHSSHPHAHSHPHSYPQAHSQPHPYAYSPPQSQSSSQSHPNTPPQPHSRPPSLLYPPITSAAAATSTTTTPMQTRSPPLTQPAPPLSIPMSAPAPPPPPTKSTSVQYPQPAPIPPRLDPTALFTEVTRSLPRTCPGILALHLEYDLSTSASEFSAASANNNNNNPASSSASRNREGQMALSFLARFPKVQVLDKISNRTAAFLVPYFAFPFDLGSGGGGGVNGSGGWNGMDVDEKEKVRERERDQDGRDRDRDRERIHDPLQSLHTMCFLSVDFTKLYSTSWSSLKASLGGEGVDVDVPLSRQPPLMELRHILLEYVERRARNDELPYIREIVFRGCRGLSEKDEQTFMSLGTMTSFYRS